MGTKTKLISKPGNFADSKYARNIEERQAAVQDYFTEKQDKFNAMVKQADETAKKRIQVRQRATNRERKKQGNSVSDITGLQDRLWRAGYYGDIPYEKAVDGIMGRMTRQAMSAALEDAKKNQNTKQKESRNFVEDYLGKKSANFLNRMYTYGYDNSKASSQAINALTPVQNAINEYGVNAINEYGIPAVNNVLDLIGIGGIQPINPVNFAEPLGKSYGVAAKIYKGLTNTDEAGKAQRMYMDLDLSDPKNTAVADSLVNVMHTEEPRWGLRSSNKERNQTAMRGRHDLNLLHGGQSQRYNTYSQENGYDFVDEDGNSYRTYTFTDPKMRKQEEAFLRNYANTHQAGANKDGTKWWYIEGGDPYAQYGNFMLYESPDGYLYSRDNWDYGKDNISSNLLLPGTEKIYTGIKFRK